jgi:3-methyladenine DNA glycosylase AlkC
MAEALKNMFSAAFFDDLTAALAKVYPAFDREAFLARIYDEAWEGRALKDRMRHITLSLRHSLPENYRAALDVLRAAAPYISNYSFQLMFYPDFVEVYGLDDWEASLPALEQFTVLCSSEFAVRPYIVRDTPRMMAQMLAWAGHENHHVRRLASEGCRPRLPWAMALPDFKRDPSPILPVLERLKNDESEYVRRSVANNLNDIAKDHPDVVIETLRRWSADANPQTDWIIRRALRTLVKAGHSEALGLLGYSDGAQIAVKNVALSAEQIQLGGTLTFRFEVESAASQPQDLMIDYVVYFKKANGSLAPKVFKLSQRQIAPGETLTIERRQHFKPISTRVYYAGEHRLALKINGQEFEGGTFYLTL